MLCVVRSLVHSLACQVKVECVKAILIFALHQYIHLSFYFSSRVLVLHYRVSFSLVLSPLPSASHFLSTIFGFSTHHINNFRQECGMAFIPIRISLHSVPALLNQTRFLFFFLSPFI